MNFKGKRVIVTGAGGIFGFYIAAAFAKAGARLCLSDHRSEIAAELPRRLGVSAADCLVHATDLTQDRSIDELVALVADNWGAPDILVNNAGVYPRALLLDTPAAEWDRILGVNLRAPFLLTRAMAKLMVARGVKGSIVNISSGASRSMRTGLAPYCVSKAALERLTKGFALELAPHEIRVNAVEPGFAPGSTVSPLSDEYVAAMRARIPLGRVSGPEDTPNAVLFLCSDAAAYMTGATISVDGGNSIGTFEPGFTKSEAR